MATYYDYVCDGATKGPVRFHELVRLIHRGELRADDLVRADYENNWRSAASVVGLFHMARREDVLELLGIENNPSSNAPNDAEQDCDIESYGISRNARVRESKIASDAASLAKCDAEHSVNETPVSDTIEPSVTTAIAEAVAACDAHDQIETSQNNRPTISHRALHLAFRWVGSLLLANLMAVGVVGWSTTEAQRMPNPEKLAVGIRTFPLWGQCEPVQYTALLVGTMGVAGAVGYAGTRLLESLADD